MRLVNLTLYLVFSLSMSCGLAGANDLLQTVNAGATVRPVVRDAQEGPCIEYWSGEAPISRVTDAAPAGVELKVPGSNWSPLRFRQVSQRDGVIECGPERVGTLTFRWRLEQKTPSLVERTLQVMADSPQQFTLAFPLEVIESTEMASFTGPVLQRVRCDTVRGAERTETLPVGMARQGQLVLGIVADTPGNWENRCQVLLEPD